MIKHVSSVLVLSTLLVGCGGSDSNDKKPPKSSAAVSSSSVAVSSSAPASSVAPSSVAPSSVATSSSEPASSSSSSGPEVIDAVMTTDVWRGNSDGVVSGSNLGITLVATADGQGAVFDVAAPRLLEGATIEMVVNVSNEYQASGADLQVFAQIKDNASYPGEYDCYTPNAQLTPGTDQVIECVIDESDKKFNQTTFDVQVGIQGKLQTGTIAGTVVIKSAKITLAAQSSSSSSTAQSSSVASSAPSNQLAVPVTSLDNWSTDQTPSTLTVNGGISITPDWSAADNKAMFILDQPIDLTGATVTYVVSVPQSYITDGGMVVQPFSQQNSGDYVGIFDGSISGGWNPASTLTAGDNTIVHGPFTAPPANIQRIGLQLKKQTKADGVTGDVVIRSITVKFPE